jgi:hypothetical protein
MNPLTISLLACAACLFMARPLIAQDSDATTAPAPTDVAAKFPQGNAEFTILVDSGKAPVASPVKNGPHTPMKIEVTQAGALQRRAITWSDGKQTEDWGTGEYVIAQNPYGSWLNIFLSGGIGAPPYPTRAADFEKLSTSNYKGPSEFEGEKCYLYQMAAGPQPAEPYLKKSSGDRMYWISISSLLPVAVKSGDVTYRYQFLLASGEALQLPPRYQHEWDQFRACNPGIAP